MPDWKKLVRERFGTLNLPPEAKDDIVAELAGHFEDSVVLDNEASQSEDCALSQVEWVKLARAIERSKRKEDALNHRLKSSWLPAMGILFAVGVILVLLDRAAFLQRLIFLSCMAILLCGAAFEPNRLNQRARVFWVPGFFSLIAATLFLYALDAISDPSRFFREMSLRPQELLWAHEESTRSFYFFWLLAQVAFGALAAYVSRRAGGSRASRIFAGTLPAMLVVGTYVLLIPITARYTIKAATSALGLYLASALIIWIVAPLIAVFAGALPFLRESALGEVAQS